MNSRKLKTRIFMIQNRLMGLLLATVGSVAGFAVGAESEFVLVREGADAVPIIVARDAPHYTRRAADELAAFVEKTSGAKPQVIEGMPAPRPDHAIWVGHQPDLEAVFPKLNFTFEHPEETLIACDGKNLVIAGRDRWDPQNPTGLHEGGKKIFFQAEYGTANVVYTFVQDDLGVRWLWPGDLGEDILERKTITFAPFERRYHPQIRHRAGIFGFMAANHRRGSIQDWPRYHRLLLGSIDTKFAGHGFSTWWDRYHEQHPDYFALQPDGTRSGYPEPGNAKICHSNPAVWKQWLANVEEELRANPHATVFNASPNDSYSRGHCVCEKCRAWDHPDAERFVFGWARTGPRPEGPRETHPALSDRHVKFANIVAGMLREKYPDKDYYVAMLAYGWWRPAPLREVPANNVLIVNVANFFWDVNNPGTMKDPPAKQFADWGKLAHKQIWRPNTGDPAGWQKGLPDVPFTRRAEVFRHVAENNCVGIYVDKVWNYWATQGPIYYLMAKLAWDPRADEQAIMDDYYERGFGPAAAELKAYWTLMEQARDRKVDEFPGETEGYAEVYDTAFFKTARDLIDQATAKVANAPEKYADRVDRVRVGLDFTQLMSEIRAEVAKVIASKGKDKEADKKARALWTQVDEMAKAHPDAMNWKYLTPQSRQMQRGGVMHPDHLNSKDKQTEDPKSDLF